MGTIQKTLIKAAGILTLLALYSFVIYQWGATECELGQANDAKEDAEENRKDATLLAEMERQQAPEKEKIITRYVTLTKVIKEAPDDEKNSIISPLIYSVMYNREPVQRNDNNGQ